tara:strand:- start:75 stop:275 length:201 start_codon:yes stop_codon:yes gene_type:complete
MQTNKQISDQAFDMAKSIQDVSRKANLYGRLMANKDMQIYLLKEENKIKANLKTLEENEREESKCE